MCEGPLRAEKITLAGLLLQYLDAMGRTAIFAETWRRLDGYHSVGDAWSKLDNVTDTM